MSKLSVDRAILTAKSHAKRGEIEAARGLYEVILQSFPSNKRALQGLAALSNAKPSFETQHPPQEIIQKAINLYNQGHLTSVVDKVNTLIEQYPNSFILWNILGAASAQTGKLDQAINAFKSVITIKPNYIEAYNNIGNAYKALGNLDEAIASYNKAISLKADYVEAYYNIGVTYQEQGNLDEAVLYYNKALSLKPDYTEAYYNIGYIFKDQGKLDEAVAAYNKAISLKPDYAEAYYNVGIALQEQGNLNEAISSYKNALSLKPGYTEAYYNVGFTRQEQGKLNEAIAAYNKALSLKPDYAEVHRNLSALVKYRPEDPQVALVNELMQKPDLNDDQRCHLHYALGKMNEDLGDLRAAYDNYVAGGKLRKKMLRYDFEKDRLTFDQIKNTAQKLKDFSFNRYMEAATSTPIFILGMPRSGTTLVEQIISSHSKVNGAGELETMTRFGHDLSVGKKIISSENVLQFRKSYLNELEKVSDGFKLVTDKMPHNFQYIGLILKALPEAKVIHVKRDPSATCWSNFKNYFSATGLGYSYDLEDTLKFFHSYRELMDFWDQQYSERIYHLDYDELTDDQEQETRKLIQHLGLDWEDSCLSPQENKRNVKTTSQQQVRQKIYQGSSQAWRKFEPFINGVFDSLT